MKNCVAVSTPMDPKIVLETRKTEALADKHQYQELIGSLIYAMTGTRPDIAFPVQKLSQFLSDPSVIHMQAPSGSYDICKALRDLELHMGGQTRNYTAMQTQTMQETSTVQNRQVDTPS